MKSLLVALALSTSGCLYGPEDAELPNQHVTVAPITPEKPFGVACRKSEASFVEFDGRLMIECHLGRSEETVFLFQWLHPYDYVDPDLGPAWYGVAMHEPVGVPINQLPWVDYDAEIECSARGQVGNPCLPNTGGFRYPGYW